jgi:hypothetical protein
MRMFALALAAATCLTVAPALAGSPVGANNPTTLAQLDVRIGGDRDRDRDRDVRMDRDRDRDHCRTSTIRETLNGEIVVRRERHCD